MKNNRTQTQVGLWLSALCLMLTFQSCNKQEEAAPSNLNAVAGTANVIAAPCKIVGLVAGQHTLVGTVGVGVASNGDVQVTYTITAPGIYLNEIHLDAFTSTAQLQAAKKVSNGGAIPGKFAFKQSWNNSARATTYTQTIPKAYIDQLGGTKGCFFIASHAALSNGETAWGGLYRTTSTGVSVDTAKQFAGGNWSVYFEFCTSECAQTIDYTYAWEDRNDSGNDADYNDLVMQSDIIKTGSELKINFLATARGASFDHKFKFKIPKAGITQIFGDASYTSDATYYYITVFASTKNALVSPSSVFANTEPQLACAPFASKQVILTLDNGFSYDAAKPFEPFITVYRSGDASSGTGNDLYVYSVSNRDTWTATDGKVYPNGIVIPSDWRWPIEGVTITRPYPNFSFSIANGIAANWATTPAPNYFGLTFNKNQCL